MKRCFVILFSVMLIIATSNTVDAQKRTIKRDNQKTEQKSKTKPGQTSKTKSSSTQKGKSNVASQNSSPEIEYIAPFVTKNHSNTLQVKSVKLYREQTAITFSDQNDYYDGWMQIDPKAYIVANGKKYYLKRAEGIKLSPKKTFFDYVGQTLTFTLYFPAIPSYTNSIDFIEDESSEWRVYGIRLQSSYSSNQGSKTYISINCNASDGSLYIDGDYYGKPNGLHEVSNGSHSVKIVAQGYYDYESSIDVSPSNNSFSCQLNRDFNYKENEYLVSFTCNAVNASLYIDGKYMGNANGNYNILKGTHAVQIRCTGYIDHTSVLEVKSSNTIHYDLIQSTSSSGMSSSINTSSTNSSIIQKTINDMVYIEGGTFKMGATNEQGKNIFNDEKPVHKVTVSNFYISKYEVTQELWVEVMGTNPSRYVGDLNRPVDRVSWDDCQQFIRKLNQITGKHFRLPTEAEWEYAARGGNRSQNYIFSGSNSIENVAWYGNNSDFSTHPVGMKSSNELGLYDMSGNVTEWCQDWYGGTYYKSSTSNNPAGPPSGTNRISRGGCWSHSIGNCRISRRLNYQSSVKTEYQGLRLAASSL